jgi:hypothetical protein
VLWRPLLASSCLGVLTFWAIVTGAVPPIADADPWLHLEHAQEGTTLHPTHGFVLERNEQQLPPGHDGRAEEAGARLRIAVLDGAGPFPLEEGSAVLWMLPRQPLGGDSQWLLMGSWAGFDIHLQGARLLAYATSDHRHAVSADISAAAMPWAGRWHCVVLTWKGARRVLYVDGQLLARRDGVAPLEKGPPRIDLGFLHAWGKRPEGGYFRGRLGGLAVLRRALAPEEVEGLDDALRSAGPEALTGLIAGGVQVTVPRRAWIRGETLNARLRPRVSGERLYLRAYPLDGPQRDPLVLFKGEVEPATVEVDTRRLRPGRYRLAASVAREEGQDGRGRDVVVRVRARRLPDLPVGIDALGLYPDRLLAWVAEWGVAFTSSGNVPRESSFARDLDRLLLHGLAYMPALNIHHQKVMSLEEPGYFDERGRGTARLENEVLQTLVLHGDRSYGRYSSSLASPFSPVARAAMARRLRDLMAAAEDHPGLFAVAFDDEYNFRVGTDRDSGRRYYGDYSPSARAYFRSRTGLEAPFPPQDPPGTVFPDDHPYLHWRDLVGMPGDATSSGLSRSWAELTSVVHGVRPDVVTTTYSGGEYGSVDAVMDYGYPAIWEPRPHFLIGHGRLDFLFDRHRARQRVAEPRPLWALLGWWSHDLRQQPAWSAADLRLNTVLALAKGARLIHWFTTWPRPDDPSLPGSGLLSREDLRQEVERWARWIKTLGPMYARLEHRREGQVAVLLSEDDRAGKVHRENQPLQLNTLYAALRMAGYSPDLVTDEMVEEGALAAYEALVLADFDHASASLWQAMQGFAGQPGKRVFADRASALQPDGAIELPFRYDERAPADGRFMDADLPPLGDLAAMGARVRGSLAPHLLPAGPVTEGSDYVAPFMLHADGARLLILVNYHLDQEQAVQVRLPARGAAHVYPAGSRESLATVIRSGALTFDARVPAAGHALFLVTPRPVARLDVDLTVDGDRFTVAASVTGPGGVPIPYPFPLELELIDREGRTVDAYHRNTATDPASGVLELDLPRSDLMDTAGVWELAVRERFLGMEARAASAGFGR